MPFFIYGKQPIAELIKSKAKVERVYTSDPKCDLAASLKQHGANVILLTKGEFAKRFADQVNQGVVAEIASFQYKDEDWLLRQPVSSKSLLVMLDGIEDPQNLGAIARSALAAGATALLIRKDRQAMVTPSAIKASAGYLLHLPVVLFTNAVSVTKLLKKNGYWAVGALGGAKQIYQTVDVSLPLVVVIGSEHAGISRLMGEHVDFPVSIPMANNVDSLNASAASAVILLDFYTRRLQK